VRVRGSGFRQEVRRFMKRSLHVALTQYGLMVLAVFCASLLDAAEIRFRSQAQCDGRVVRLGDVADIISVDRREREALKEIELGPASLTRQTLYAREVQDRLVEHGVKLVHHEFSGAGAIQLSPHSAARATAERQPISKSAVNLARTAAADAIVAHLKSVADAEEDWTVEVDLTTDQLRLISGERARPSASGGREPWIGQQRFTLTMPRDNGGQSFTIAADVKRAPRAVVAINAIARGERIRAGDVALETVSPGSPQRITFESLDEVIGKEAARTIAAGQTLDNQHVRSPLLVKRGDVVDVFARSGGVQVSTKARAREEGSHGDLINVELLNDRRPLIARVCGIQEVEILAAAPTVSE
jgi:flagella basal body P-ring formation protein FlgA